MHRSVWLRLLCASVLITLCACGQITHDIGQIRTDDPESDGNIAGDSDGSLDSGSGRDVGTGSAGEKDTSELLDAHSDGSHRDVLIAMDADTTGETVDGETDGLEADDATRDECVEENLEIEYTSFGLDIYIMMDALLFSSPVLTPEELQIWTGVQQEISAFVDDPDSEGTRVGIQYYGQREFDGDPLPSTSCEVSTYQRPSVRIAELPDNAESIKNSFPRNPFPTSPAVPALEGAIRHAKSRVRFYPERKQIVFLITGPSVRYFDLVDPACGSTIEDLWDVAEQGYASDPSIATYVIGVYAFEIDVSALMTNLRGVAIGGGSSRPYLASINLENPNLAHSMGLARDAAKRSACGFSLPQEYPDGLPEAIDLDFVSIAVTTDSNETIPLQSVPDHSFCNPEEAGWYFDNSVDPTFLVACESTCEVFNSESISKAELRLNCP